MKKWLAALKKRLRFEKDSLIALLKDPAVATLVTSWTLLIILAGVNQILRRQDSQEFVQRIQLIRETMTSNAQAIQSNAELIDEIVKNQQSAERQKKERPNTKKGGRL